MKSRRILFVFLLSCCFCLLAGFQGRSWGAIPPAQAQRSSPGSLPCAAIISF